MGGAEVGTALVASALAAALDWRILDARDPRSIRAEVARTLGRREHLVVAAGPLTAENQQAIRGDLHGVRFVDLATSQGDEHDIVRAIRDEFGL